MVECDLVEAYFEMNGFLARKNHPPITKLSRKNHEPFPQFTVFNPKAQESSRKLGFRLFSGDLMQVQSAQVFVMGWENTSFSNSLLNSDAKLLKFLKQEINSEKLSLPDQHGNEYTVSTDDLMKVIVVPSLPVGLDRMKVLEEYLKQIGLQGILTLKSILENLFRQALPSKLQMGGGEILHLLQMIKSYQLFRDPQVDIFDSKKSNYET